MHGASKNSWKTLIGRIFSIAFLKPFSCVGVLFSLSPWVGGNSLMVYMVYILQGTGSSIDPDIGVIIVGAIRLMFAGTENRWNITIAFSFLSIIIPYNFFLLIIAFNSIF